MEFDKSIPEPGTIDYLVKHYSESSRIRKIEENPENDAVAFYSRDSDFPFGLIRAINNGENLNIYNIYAAFDPEIGHATAKLVVFEE